jgi:DNA anti-recombination protein RmuC
MMRALRMTVAALHQRMNKRFSRLGRRVDARFKQVDARFDAVDARFNAMDDRFDTLGRQFGRLLGSVEKIGDKLDQNLKRLNEEVATCLLAVNTHETRLNELPARAPRPEESPPPL